MEANHQSRSWDFSLWMLVTYVSVFVAWRAFPTRASFVLIGMAAVIGLVLGMRRALARRYFVNRVDVSVHALVIIDLILETFAFEAFRLIQPAAIVSEFHNNTNFFGCSLAFTLVIGVHRWVVMNYGKTASANEPMLGRGGL